MGRLLVLTLLAGFVFMSARAVLPSSRIDAHPQPELAAAARLAAEQGLHAELPPHISTLLGLAQEEKCAVMQGVLRSSGKIQGFEVIEKSHNDIIIFVVDESTKDQIFYLTSPSGTLRRVLSVKQGIGHVVKPTNADVEAFQREKLMWEKRLARRTQAN